jgi:5-formyltetrahydrofolate cyclo-ligase
MALREGKVVYVAVPRLRTLECFLELDPSRLGERLLQAASIKGAERLGRLVGIEALPAIDLIVCGAVAVNGRGARVGQGGGFSDLEYGLLSEAGRVDRHTPIVTTVHSMQMLPHAIEMQVHDIPVDVVVTPDGPMPRTAAFPRPRGIYRELLTPEKVAEVPVLAMLLDAGRPTDHGRPGRARPGPAPRHGPRHRAVPPATRRRGSWAASGWARASWSTPEAWSSP